MSLSTFNSKIIKVPLVRSLIASFSFLTIYQVLIFTKFIKPSDGLHQWQDNFIRVQRYAYQNSSHLKLVLVGSSLTRNLPTSDMGSSVMNLGMSAGCTQTGIEAVERKSSRPSIVLVEMNESINRKVDAQMIGSIYNPFLYNLRLYLPMFKEEYQPVSTFLPKVKFLLKKLARADKPTNQPKVTGGSFNEDKKFLETLISQEVATYKIPLSEDEKHLLRQEAASIKLQISRIRKNGVRVVLFDIPREPRVQATLKDQQIKALMKEIFPVKDFEWLPEPPSRQWQTSDGIHLVSSDAKDYVVFLNNQLLKK